MKIIILIESEIVLLTKSILSIFLHLIWFRFVWFTFRAYPTIIGYLKPNFFLHIGISISNISV